MILTNSRPLLTNLKKKMFQVSQRSDARLADSHAIQNGRKVAALVGFQLLVAVTKFEIPVGIAVSVQGDRVKKQHF